MQAEVKASGVAHADADRVNVLLYVEPVHHQHRQQRPAAGRAEPGAVSMVRRDGAWLVNDITSY